MRNRLSKFAFSFSTALVVIGWVGSAMAQTIPPSAQPGVVLRGVGTEERARSRLEDSVTIPKMEGIKGGGSTEKVFVLKGVVLDGSDVYKAEDFKSIYGSFIGQKVSFADLNTIALGVTRKYREDGYIFSRVVLPPQKVSDGILHLQAVEGRIANVELVGDYVDNSGLIKAMAEKIRTEGPANTKMIERYLLLIDDLPGVTARSFVKPSDVKGGGDLVISVERDPFEGSGSVDNRGSAFLGQTRLTAVGAFNSFFRSNDRTTLRGIVTGNTDEMRFADISHEEQIGTEGMRLNMRAAFTGTHPGGSIKNLDIEGDSQLLDFGAMYPFIRSRAFNLSGTGGLTIINSSSDLLGVEVSKDKLRYLNAGMKVDFNDSLKGINQIDLGVSKGLRIFDATRDGTGRSRANGDHEFLKETLTVTRVQDLFVQDLSLRVSGTGQYTKDPLLSSEEFALGGEGFGRAYDGGEIVGDRGIAGLAELRYGGPVDHDVLKSYQVYGYYDIGKVTNLDPVVGETRKESLASAGAGLRFNLKNDISGYVEMDAPLTRDVNAEHDDNPRYFFSLLKRF